MNFNALHHAVNHFLFESKALTFEIIKKMKENLKVSWIEYDIQWEDSFKNRTFLDELLKDHETDVVVLPEMFTTGFSMNPRKVAEEAFGETYEWMKEKAKKGNFAICGSIPIHEEGKYYNRFYFVTPDQSFFYDKKHLFGYGKETEVYSPGNSLVSIDYLGWKFRLIICYDLRFPAWCRNTDDYDVLLCPASWPQVREEAWKTLLKARAIENMAYTIGVNRTGIDGYKLVYNGQSKAFSAIGEDLAPLTYGNFLFQIKLSKKELNYFREKYRFLNDRDSFQMH